jgi:glucose uptake protein
MILPATTLASLLLLFLTLFCWGSWANTQKLVFKWRFELYYYDFAVGAAIAILIAVYTLGSANPQELTVSDNMMIAGYRKMAYAIATGLVVNLANIMLVAAISLSGMAVAFPTTFGVGLIVMSISNLLGNQASNNVALLFGGVVLLLTAVLADIFAYRSYLDFLATQSKSGPVLNPGTRLPVRPPNAYLGIILSAVGGIAWGFFFPLIDMSRSGENGVGPYGQAGLIGAGIFFSTLLYVPFFVNFPVQGEAVQVRSYFKGAKRQHFWGIFGGIIWGIGLVAVLVEGAAPTPVKTGPVLSSALIYGAPILATLWGLLVWHEFKGAPQSVKMLQLGMIVLFLAGMLLIALAPVYASK